MVWQVGRSIFIVRGYLERNGSTASLEPLSSSACFPALLQQSNPRLWRFADDRKSIHKTLSDLKTSYTQRSTIMKQSKELVGGLNRADMRRKVREKWRTGRARKVPVMTGVKMAI